MWRPVDTDFFYPRCPVEIVDFGASSEALLLRSALESMSAVVLLHQIGTPDDLLQVLGQGEQCAPYMVLCGHGEENGLVLGEYAEGLDIDVSMLVNGRMPAHAIAQRVNLPGCVVVNTCCSGGSPELANAFMAGGLRFYLGADRDYLGSAAPLFVTHFFYALLTRALAVPEAWREAAGYDRESSVFTLYDCCGQHSLQPE